MHGCIYASRKLKRLGFWFFMFSSIIVDRFFEKDKINCSVRTEQAEAQK